MTIKGVDIIMLSKKVFITVISALGASTAIVLTVAAVNLKILPSAIAASDTSSYVSSAVSTMSEVSSAVSSAASSVPVTSSKTISSTPAVSIPTPSSTASVDTPSPIVVAPAIITPKIIEAKVYNMNYVLTARGATITFTKCTSGANGFCFEASFQSNKTFIFSQQGMTLKTEDGTPLQIIADSGNSIHAEGQYPTKDWLRIQYPNATSVTKLFFTYNFKDYNIDPVDNTTAPQTVEIDLQ
jgi:hypothetical protein